MLCSATQRSQRRTFYYWFNFADNRASRILSKKTTNLSKYTASYPNAQELPDTSFSFYQRQREVRMLSSKKHEVAQSALLQFNVMVRQKVKPNVMTYTSLIKLMGEADMELTAYKLFNRMLQQEVIPIPETYMALLEATSPLRGSLMAEIQRKMYSCVQTGPRELLKRKRELINEELVAANQYVKDLSTEDPEDIAEMNLQKELQKLHSLANYEQLDPDSSNATVYVDSLRKAFYGNAWENAGKNSLSIQQRDNLRPQIERLSDLELGMFLTIHRQERPESRKEKIDHILLNIQEGFIYEMLQQRQAYVNSMKEVMQRNTKMSELITSEITNPTPGTTEYRNLKNNGGKVSRTSKLVLKTTKKKKKDKKDKKKNPHVQSGIVLRGTYKINYVKLARRGQLATLSLSQLKEFYNGEELQGLGFGGATGTIAKYVQIIEKYLFGEASENVLKAITPSAAARQYHDNSNVAISISDTTDEFGNEPAENKKQDSDLQSLLKVMPYTFRSKIIHHVPSPTGGQSRIRLSKISRGGLQDYIRRDKEIISQAQKKWLRRYNRSGKNVAEEDIELYHKVVKDPSDRRSLYEDYVGGKRTFAHAQESTVKAMKYQHYMQKSSADLNNLGPLRLHIEKEVERKRQIKQKVSNSIKNQVSVPPGWEM